MSSEHTSDGPPTSYPPYQAQLARAARFYDRMLQRVGPLRGLDDRLARYEDDVWSFFIHGWHVRDWIKHDETLDQAMRERCLRTAEESRWLCICADLANGRKHLRLSRRRVGAEFASLHTTGSADLTEWWTEMYLDVADDDEPIAAVEVTWQALRAWQEILHGEGLPLPPEFPDLSTRPAVNAPRCPPAVPPRA